jgi:hypothetical protein
MAQAPKTTPTQQKADTATLLAVDCIFFVVMYMAISVSKVVIAVVFSKATQVSVQSSILSWSSLFVSAALTGLIHWLTADNKDFLYAIEESKKSS